ncbi:unknown similar to AMEV218 [Choristoneura rosaceana entomopoxvirus 'L']|uniref:N1R/p28-like protein n=1 Tax=Choristoneura rosaceana entomopoxvirus 'L' TaxID=1293539 RepID=A0ABM9QKR3_9POXV|nr:unknown similar to AMEV218 [Choristoneura rosaceana entomopoxvirus 'L']CCU56115.1 unknown similar to AMEV218 [Choristoneura rosaceana entomopoxvirus 'L']
MDKFKKMLVDYKKIIYQQKLPEYININKIYFMTHEDNKDYLTVEYDISDCNIMTDVKSYFQKICNKELVVKSYEKKIYYYNGDIQILHCIKYKILTLSRTLNLFV